MAILKLDTKEFTDFLKNFGSRLEKSFDSRKAVTESAALIASLIRTRTLSGRDIDMRPFKPYRSRGRSGGSSRVDLSSSGEMLDSIEVKVLSDTEAVVGIFDPFQQRKAVIHQLGLGNAPVRRFFGVSETDSVTMSRILEIFTREINKAVNRI